MTRCKQHKNLTIIERVFIEQVFHVEEGKLSEESIDWSGDVITWHDPRPISITVMCFDCGFERIYGPHATLPKWVKAVWNGPYKEEA